MGACAPRPREVNARDASVRSAASEGARALEHARAHAPFRRTAGVVRRAAGRLAERRGRRGVDDAPRAACGFRTEGERLLPERHECANRPCPLPRVSSHERRPERGLRALFPQPHAADVSSAALSIKRLRRRATPGDALRASHQHQREASLELEDEINFPRPPRHLSATDESGKTPACENPLSPHPLPPSASASESTSTPEPSPRGRRLVLTPSPTGGRLVVEPALSRIE